MAGLNKVMVIGNCGKDPELRYTANGKAVCNFSVASNRVFNVDGDRQEAVDWFNVTTWEKLAELCSQYLLKGRQVYVEGRLQTRKWEASDGTTRYVTEIVATNVLFLGSQTEERSPALAGAGSVDPDDLPFE